MSASRVGEQGILGLLISAILRFSLIEVIFQAYTPQRVVIASDRCGVCSPFSGHYTICSSAKIPEIHPI
jgi:hypothetical protein